MFHDLSLAGASSHISPICSLAYDVAASLLTTDIFCYYGFIKANGGLANSLTGSFSGRSITWDCALFYASSLIRRLFKVKFSPLLYQLFMNSGCTGCNFSPIPNNFIIL